MLKNIQTIPEKQGLKPVRWQKETANLDDPFLAEWEVRSLDVVSVSDRAGSHYCGIHRKKEFSDKDGLWHNVSAYGNSLEHALREASKLATQSQQKILAILQEREEAKAGLIALMNNPPFSEEHLKAWSRYYSSLSARP